MRHCCLSRNPGRCRAGLVRTRRRGPLFLGVCCALPRRRCPSGGIARQIGCSRRIRWTARRSLGRRITSGTATDRALTSCRPTRDGAASGTLPTTTASPSSRHTDEHGCKKNEAKRLGHFVFLLRNRCAFVYPRGGALSACASWTPSLAIPSRICHAIFSLNAAKAAAFAGR